MTRFIVLLSACALICLPLINARAADAALVGKLFESVNSSPKRQKLKEGQFKVDVRRSAGQGQMTLVSQSFPDGRRAFGVQAVYVVGAKESNYDLDTPCHVFLASSKGDGVQDILLDWNCIAWTPTMEKFVNNKDNLQRIFDALIVEAGTLMEVK